MQVKICGITNAEDALAAEHAGADAIGLIFYEGSKREVSITQAREIVSAVSPYTAVVGLFVDADKHFVDTVLGGVSLSQLQFHGSESPAFCASFERPYVKSIPVSNPANMQSIIASHSESRAFLFDTLVPGEHGGTGKAFDWRLMPGKNIGHRVLAGGLDAENVAEAIRIARPHAVDVSSGVEAKPGIKDHNLVRRFVMNAKHAGKEANS